jgi:hypothetical protein
LPTKIATATTNAKKIYDENFTKITCLIHPSIIPFLTAMELSDNPNKRSNSDEEEMSGDDDSKVPTERDVVDNKLQPFNAPVNHNTLNLAKAIQIVHTLMENFCHGVKGKISQMEEMGNSACVLMGYHDKVCFAILCQIIHIMNNLFQHLTLVLFIYRKSFTRRV